MNQNMSGRYWLCSLTILCFTMIICAKDGSAQEGDSNMFGLFGSKKVTSIVAPEVGAVLQRQTALPSKMPPAPVSNVPACELAHIRGELPAPQWVADEVIGETRRVFRIPAAAGNPPLAILAGSEAKKQVQVWELSNDKVPRFVKQRQASLDPEQSTWVMSWPVAVSCLPAHQLALAVGFHAPRKRDGLFTYNPGSNQFRRISLIEPERSNGPPFTPFEILAASPDATLVLYHTDGIRISADNFAYQFDHVLLFSSRFPNGLEVLKLAVDDGNVWAWAMAGKTLWLQSRDKRKKTQDFIWSLDLGKVL
jgi:hypothetical protein